MRLVCFVLLSHDIHTSMAPPLFWEASLLVPCLAEHSAGCDLHVCTSCAKQGSAVSTHAHVHMRILSVMCRRLCKVVTSDALRKKKELTWHAWSRRRLPGPAASRAGRS